MGQPLRRPSGLFGRWAAETGRIAAILRKEAVGGVLLLAGAVLALGWANSPWSASYRSLLSYRVGLSGRGWT